MAVIVFPSTTTRLLVDLSPCPHLRNAHCATSPSRRLVIAPTLSTELSLSTRSRGELKKKKRNRTKFSLDVFALAASSENFSTDDSLEVGVSGRSSIPTKDTGDRRGELGRNLINPPDVESKVKYISEVSSEEESLPSSSSSEEPLAGNHENGNGSYGTSEQQLPPLKEFRAKPYRNRLLGLSKIGTVINDAAESFFKSEIRRRIFVTVVLIMASRLGYFIPIPGFDRRFMPGDYLALVSGAVGKKLCNSGRVFREFSFLVLN